MNQCTSDVLEKYLKTYGWSFRTNGQGVWMTGWASEKRSYPLRIILDESFITLNVQPLLKLDVDLEAYPELAVTLLEVNQHCHLVKIAIDEVGDIVLSLSLVSEFFSYELFSTSIGLLGYYSDYLYDEITSFFDRLGQSIQVS